MGRLSGRQTRLIAVGILLVVLAGTGLYFWLSRNQPSPTSVSAAWPASSPRLSALMLIPPNKLSSQQRLDLISALETEIQIAEKRSPATELSDGYSEDLIELTLKVASLRDGRSVPVLAKVLDVSTSVDEAVADFGNAAVDPVLQKLADPNLKPDATETLGFLLKGQKLRRNTLDPANRSRIEAELITLADDREWRTRRLAVRGLGFAEPRETILHKLRAISLTDPFVRVLQSNGQSQESYPVRQEAVAALARLSR